MIIMSTIPKSLLKDLPLKLQESSRKNRLELLNSISKAFKNASEKTDEESVPAELAAKSLAKILPMVLPRYMDNPSRMAMNELIQIIVEKHPESVIKILTASLSESFSSWSSIYPSLYSAKIAIAGLQWTLILANEATKKGYVIYLYCKYIFNFNKRFL